MISISLLPYVFEDKTDLFYQHKESLNYSLINDYYAPELFAEQRRL